MLVFRTKLFYSRPGKLRFLPSLFLILGHLFLKHLSVCKLTFAIYNNKNFDFEFYKSCLHVPINYSAFLFQQLESYFQTHVLIKRFCTPLAIEYYGFGYTLYTSSKNMKSGYGSRCYCKPDGEHTRKCFSSICCRFPSLES